MIILVKFVIYVKYLNGSLYGNWSLSSFLFIPKILNTERPKKLALSPFTSFTLQLFSSCPASVLYCTNPPKDCRKMSVRVLNPNAEVLNKSAALHMTINAAKGLQDVLESNLGPKGTIKMYLSSFVLI